MSIDYQGVNHITLVTHDMAETTDFFQNTLEMPLVRAVEYEDGSQQFYFDCGGDRLLSFLWWPDAPGRAEGIASMRSDHQTSGFDTAHGSMNHLAFSIDLDRFEAIVARLKNKGVATRVINHGQFMSVYFRDNNNIHMEFAALTRPFTPADVQHDPVNEKGVKVPRNKKPLAAE